MVYLCAQAKATIRFKMQYQRRQVTIGEVPDTATPSGNRASYSSGLTPGTTMHLSPGFQAAGVATFFVSSKLEAVHNPQDLVKVTACSSGVEKGSLQPPIGPDNENCPASERDPSCILFFRIQHAIES